jgi:hypothetical protein
VKYEVTVTEWRMSWRARWRLMWALEISGEGATQCYPNIRDAEHMVRDYLNCTHDDGRGDDASVSYRFDLALTSD